MLYRNLASQDAFADTARELWQFPGWQPSARTAVQPLSACDPGYLLNLAEVLLEEWGDARAARVVANEIRMLAGAPPLGPECITGEQLREEGRRLMQEAGVTPVPDYVELRTPERITCSEDWVLVEELDAYASQDAADAGYAYLYGPLLARWDGHQWVGVSALMHPFDCGVDGCGDLAATNPGACADAPQRLRARLGC